MGFRRHVAVLVNDPDWTVGLFMGQEPRDAISSTSSM